MSWHLTEPHSTAAARTAPGGSGSVLGGRFKRWFFVPRFSRWTIAARIIAILLTLAVPLAFAHTVRRSSVPM